MSEYEKQVLAIGRNNDSQIRAIERDGNEVLSSVVEGSNLHGKISNPWDEGIDEG